MSSRRIFALALRSPALGGLALGASLLLAGCSVPPWDDVVEQYAARKNGVTVSAGDAPKTNAAIQTIDPVPRSAFNTQIPANGERMAGAVERYKNVSKLPNAPRQIVPTYGGQGGAAGIGGGEGLGGINAGPVGVPNAGQ
jgi:hypothetical protein